MNIETDCCVCGKHWRGEYGQIVKVLWNRTTYSVWAWRHNECKTS